MKWWEIVAPFGLPSWAFWLGTGVLVVLTTLRLTRFVTTDTLGDYLTLGFRGWASQYDSVRAADYRRQMQGLLQKGESGEALSAGEGRRLLKMSCRLGEREDRQMPVSFPGLLAEGLACPFCVGFWIGLVVIVLTLVLAAVPVAAAIWFVLLMALSLNYVTGHLGASWDSPKDSGV